MRAMTSIILKYNQLLSRVFSRIPSKKRFILHIVEQVITTSGIDLAHTIGDGQGGYLTYRIDQFNESNDQYYIEIRDYAEGLYDKWNEEHDTIIQTAETRARWYTLELRQL